MPKMSHAPVLGGPIDGGFLGIPPVPNINRSDYISAVPMDKNSRQNKIVRGSRFAMYLWNHRRKKFFYIRSIVVINKQDFFNQLNAISRGM